LLKRTHHWIGWKIVGVANRIEESCVTSSVFGERLAIAIQAPHVFRISLQYES